jgi:hypothetical protein
MGCANDDPRFVEIVVLVAAQNCRQSARRQGGHREIVTKLRKGRPSSPISSSKDANPKRNFENSCRFAAKIPRQNKRPSRKYF